MSLIVPEGLRQKTAECFFEDLWLFDQPWDFDLESISPQLQAATPHLARHRRPPGVGPLPVGTAVCVNLHMDFLALHRYFLLPCMLGSYCGIVSATCHMDGEEDVAGGPAWCTCVLFCPSGMAMHVPAMDDLL